jgi:hypothetical protein
LIRQHRWLLGAATLGLFAAYVVLYQALSDDPPVAPTEAPLSVSPAPPAARTEQLAEAGTAAGNAVGDAAAPAANPVDIFAVRNWEPPAPAVDSTANLPPPPPEAPPIPFRYAGKLEEAGKPPIFYLAQGEEILAVHPGDLIKGDYRVGRIKNGQLHFLYRPLKIEQSIPVGGDT